MDPSEFGLIVVAGFVATVLGLWFFWGVLRKPRFKVEASENLSAANRLPGNPPRIMVRIKAKFGSLQIEEVILRIQACTPIPLASPRRTISTSARSESVAFPYSLEAGEEVRFSFTVDENRLPDTQPHSRRKTHVTVHAKNRPDTVGKSSDFFL
jgi:hypothetical protein